LTLYRLFEPSAVLDPAPCERAPKSLCKGCPTRRSGRLRFHRSWNPSSAVYDLAQVCRSDNTADDSTPVRSHRCISVGLRWRVSASRITHQKCASETRDRRRGCICRRTRSALCKAHAAISALLNQSVIAEGPRFQRMTIPTLAVVLPPWLRFVTLRRCRKKQSNRPGR
jgi:hypothetical protein